jgi:para-nitrobenzyl esterase
MEELMHTAMMRLGSLFVVLALAPIGAAQDRVKVTGGKIEGAGEKDGVRVFKGVPFAAPPVGDLRWKAPQPVKAWDSVRKAEKFGPSSEDCLYLNVWTAAKDATERRPVMVYIFGGAFNGGSTNAPLLDGTKFAKKGVVLVTIAHRVGVFGFLAHPELSQESGKGSGCYGIQDQIAALRWVKDNIAQFGGDPDQVTVFGQSSGGFSVGLLAQAPQAKGLFHRAISQSGGWMSPIKATEKDSASLVRSLPLAEEDGKKFLASLKVKDIQAARGLSANAVRRGNGGLPWPVADGETIVGDPYDLYQTGRFNDTPVLLGLNSNDGGLFGSPRRTPDEFKKSVRESFPANPDVILAAYSHATTADASRSARDLIREGLYGWPSWAWAKWQTEKGKNKAYLYYFDYGAAPGEAGHGAEVAYVFGTLGGLFRPSASKANVAMSDQIMSYWVNFAVIGDPNGRGLPKWPAFDTKEMKAMTFGKTVEAGPTPNLEKIKAFDSYWESVREKRQK